MNVSKEDLDRVKHLADDLAVDITQIASNRASTYLAIESIEKLRKNTRDNIMFIFLGAFLGFIGSLCTNQLNEGSKQKELEELHKQLLEIKIQLSNLQKYPSKKDSLQISSKKN